MTCRNGRAYGLEAEQHQEEPLKAEARNTQLRLFRHGRDLLWQVAGARGEGASKPQP